MCPRRGGRPSWPLSRKPSEASCAALTARKRQAVSASFEQASFQLLSRVQALQNTAARNKPHPQPKNPSQAGPRRQKGAPGFRAGGSPGSPSAMRQRSSRLPCSKPCQYRGACRPLGQLLSPHSSWLARSGRSPSPQEEKRHASTRHGAVAAAFCLGPGWPRLARGKRQICPDAHRPGCPTGAHSLHIGTPSHPWAPAGPSAVRSLQSLYLGSGDSHFSLVRSSYTASDVQSPRRVRLCETLPGLQHASLAGFFSTARWL